ncbi:MAG: rod shape-determining protein MreD [Alphaproteobacteria bacterium]|nr:rod shape-determining protein MreD [Alphaproteobacteria bacterium]MBV9372432.1 rod shape-determining protein MreD [Alphaproteobacteria bacterium]MBV9899492.1 rod shape-determining protein MreD [Alphaproteobacteria bacterium]
MSRIAGSGRDVALWSLRRQAVPVASTLAASALDLLPVVATTPLVPDFAYLVLLAWRLLRPELWSAQVALPLGLFNDLVAGHPLGQSMALWTITFLVFELVDSRTGWRDYWMDWLLAAFAILFYTAGMWWIARVMGSRIELAVLAPQLALSIIAYPLVARLVIALDRWRLSR